MKPPSTLSSCPVTNSESSETRNNKASATCRSVTPRPAAARSSRKPLAPSPGSCREPDTSSGGPTRWGRRSWPWCRAPQAARSMRASAPPPCTSTWRSPLPSGRRSWRRRCRAHYAPPHAPLHHRTRRVFHAQRHAANVEREPPVKLGHVQLWEGLIWGESFVLCIIEYHQCNKNAAKLALAQRVWTQDNSMS